MDYRAYNFIRAARPFHKLLQRFMFLGLVLVCFLIMLVGKLDAVLVDKLRSNVVGALIPIIDVMSHPIASVTEVINDLASLPGIRETNIKLERENLYLRQWYLTARKLQAENNQLHALLSSVSNTNRSYITARVVASFSGPFKNSLIVNAGLGQGVKSGQAVLSQQGLIGRVVQVAKNTSRVLPITDIKSRVPVVLETNRLRAIMVGNNSGSPNLAYIPQGSQLIVGDRIYSSGDGDVFPAGLPVGVILAVNGDEASIQPFEKFNRVQFVRIVKLQQPIFIRSGPKVE